MPQRIKSQVRLGTKSTRRRQKDVILISIFSSLCSFSFSAPNVSIMTETFLDIARVKMGAAGSLVVAMIAEGLAKGNEWPFVTLSSFQERAITIMRLSGSLYIGMLPVVLQKNREQWEWYSTRSPDAKWYQEARAYQQVLNLDHLDNLLPMDSDDPELNMTEGVANHIYDYNLTASAKAVISPEAKYYLPIWQVRSYDGRRLLSIFSSSSL